MRILITGGFGYLGSRLAKYLSRKGNQITLASRKNRNPPLWLPTAIVVKVDWSLEASVLEITRNIDIVIHTAGLNAIECSNDEELAFKVNRDITNQLVKSAVKQSVKKFIYLSTAHVYKNPLNGLITERSLLESEHPYAVSHKSGEDEVLLESKNIDTIIMRLSNAFGPPCDINSNCWGLLVNDLCCQAVMKNSLILRTSGMQRRDFITIDDVCRATDHLISIGSHKLGDGLFNVSGMWAPTIFEMAEYISDRFFGLTDKRLEVKINLEDDHHTMPLNFSIQKLLNTDFKLNKNIENELDDLIKFCIEKKPCKSN